MLRRICVVHIQPGKRALDPAHCTAPSRQHELTAVDHTDQAFISLERSRSFKQGSMICQWSLRGVKQCVMCAARRHNNDESRDSRRWVKTIYHLLLVALADSRDTINRHYCGSSSPRCGDSDLWCQDFRERGGNCSCRQRATNVYTGFKAECNHPMNDNDAASSGGSAPEKCRKTWRRERKKRKERR